MAVDRTMEERWRQLQRDRPDQQEEDIATGGGGGDSSGMPPDDTRERLAVLDRIALDTAEALKGIRADMKDGRDKQERDFRIGIAWTFTVALGLAALMAKGFKWF